MDIKDMLRLQTHDEVVSTLLSYVPEGWFVYKSKKFCLIIPDGITFDNPAPMLCVHTDTVSSKKPTTIDSTHGILRNPEGVLGADDRAGCFIVHNLIKEGDGRYIYGIFDEEESGCHGSSDLTKSKYFNSMVITDDKSMVTCFIGLDRRGGDEVAYYGVESERFVNTIKAVFPKYKEAIGSVTDASNLAYEYNIACCNLSVGYYNEHTSKEQLNVSEMYNTYYALLRADLSLLTTEVFDVLPVSYESYGITPYEDFNVDKFKPVVCEVCRTHDTLYHGTYGMKVCKYCLEDLEEDYDEIPW